MDASQTVPKVFVEGWSPSYRSAYLVAADDEQMGAPAELVEDDMLRAYQAIDDGSFARLAFVDGVRRTEASLYQLVDDRYVRGIAGAFACGCALVDRASAASFGPSIVQRSVIWGSGATGPLLSVRGNWSWETVSVAGDDPQAPLAALQSRMRLAEGRLAESVAVDGALVVADGPLNFSLRSHRAIVGYVKSHHRALLAPSDHARVANLCAGQRSSIFRIGDERYSCYLRLTDDALSGPWAGIVRLEFSATLGVAAAAALANTLSARLPRFAGVAHRDPRAPQNLQPIGALEDALRRRLGSDMLALRAVRESVRAHQNGAVA